MFGGKGTAKKSDVAVGVDLGNFAVKVVQLSQKKDVIQIEGAGYAKIDHSKLSGIADAIKAACAEAKLSEKRINAAINAEGVVVRYLLMPEMNNEDLDKAMEFEIERYVPFDKKEVISDYLVLKERPDTKTIKVLLVATKKDQVEKRVKLFKEGGLDPEVITIDSIVLKNVFQLNYPEKSDKTVGLLNVGAKTSNINIIKGSTSYFMRDVQLGGDSITQLLKEKLEIDVNSAEKLKCSLTADDKDKLKIIEPVLGNLLNEVYLSFDYYESEFGMVVDEVCLSGGTAQLAWLTTFLKENLNREISTLNPAAKIGIDPGIPKQKFDQYASSMVVAVGLALESFD